MIIKGEAMVTQAVQAAMAPTPDSRLREIMASLVDHLHAFVRDVRLTEDEWEQAVEGITALGKATTDSHNEVILASDVLGLSSLVGLLNNPAYGGETAAALLGPFWRLGAPDLPLGAAIARPGTPGLPAFVSGRVTGPDHAPVVDALVDVWQADPRGLYDNQIAELEGLNLRGRFRTDADGRFHFTSVKPAGYPVPVHGPIGTLLAAQRRSPYRPAHIHFMVSAPGFKTLVTQVFADDAEHLDSDVTFSVIETLIGRFQRHETLEGAPAGFSAPWCSLVYDMTLVAGESRFPTPPIR